MLSSLQILNILNIEDGKRIGNSYIINLNIGQDKISKYNVYKHRIVLDVYSPADNHFIHTMIEILSQDVKDIIGLINFYKTTINKNNVKLLQVKNNVYTLYIETLSSKFSRFNINDNRYRYIM